VNTSTQNLFKEKKEGVKLMFNNIADRYDFLNHFLSMGIDKLWRKKTINLLRPYNPEIILDIATGTADLAIEALRLNPKKIIGLDISTEMLAVGTIKIKQLQLENLIKLQEGDSENIPFPDNHFDAITVAFGVRNFENLEKGLSEMLRVAKPNGIIAILEFSLPNNKLIRMFYNFYFFYILPFIGRIISRNKIAYNYLPQSVQNFPCGNNFISILNRLGYTNAKAKTLTFGIVTIYTGIKNANR